MARGSYRTPLSRARGLGSAHSGVARFMAERGTSIALVPLTLWAVWAGFVLARGGYDEAVAFLSSPINAVLAVLLIGVSAAHMEMGMRVIVEDYFHSPPRKLLLLILNTAVCWLAGALGVFAVLKVALGGGAHL